MSKKEFPIEPMTPVIVRDKTNTWWPDLFKSLIPTTSKTPFETYHGFYQMLAPLSGNEKAIGTKNDVFELWDAERLKKEGIL